MSRKLTKLLLVSLILVVIPAIFYAVDLKKAAKNIYNRSKLNIKGEKTLVKDLQDNLKKIQQRYPKIFNSPTDDDKILLIGTSEIAEVLGSKGKKIDQIRVGSNDSLLIWAVQLSAAAIVKYLLTLPDKFYKNKQEFVNSTNKYGDTPLITLVRSHASGDVSSNIREQNVAIIDEFIKIKAIKVDKKDKYDKTFFHIAAEKGLYYLFERVAMRFQGSMQSNWCDLMKKSKDRLGNTVVDYIQQRPALKSIESELKRAGKSSMQINLNSAYGAKAEEYNKLKSLIEKMCKVAIHFEKIAY